MKFRLIWDEDPESHEAQSNEWINLLVDLVSHPGWDLLQEAISDEVEYLRDQLEYSSKDDDILRGQIKALRDVRQLPRETIASLQSGIGAVR